MLADIQRLTAQQASAMLQALNLETATAVTATRKQMLQRLSTFTKPPVTDGVRECFLSLQLCGEREADCTHHWAPALWQPVCAAAALVPRASGYTLTSTEKFVGAALEKHGMVLQAGKRRRLALPGLQERLQRQDPELRQSAAVLWLDWDSFFSCENTQTSKLKEAMDQACTHKQPHYIQQLKKLGIVEPAVPVESAGLPVTGCDGDAKAGTAAAVVPALAEPDGQVSTKAVDGSADKEVGAVGSVAVLPEQAAPVQVVADLKVGKKGKHKKGKQGKTGEGLTDGSMTHATVQMAPRTLPANRIEAQPGAKEPSATSSAASDCALAVRALPDLLSTAGAAAGSKTILLRKKQQRAFSSNLETNPEEFKLSMETLSSLLQQVGAPYAWKVTSY